MTAMAFRGSRVWPVVFNDAFGNLDAWSLFAVNNPATSTNWHMIGAGLLSSGPGGRFRSDTSDDGQLVMVGQTGGGVRLSGVGGLVGIDPNAVAAAFDDFGTLITASQYDVAGYPGYAGPMIVDLAVSPLGDVGLIDDSGDYWQYTALLGSWLMTDLQWSPNQESVDLEFDALGRPHAVGYNSGGGGGGAPGGLVAMDFDTITGQWASTLLNGGSSAKLALGADSDATVGTAYVVNDSLYHAYKTGIQAWQTVLVTNDASSTDLAGIAYDFNDFPVISYGGPSGIRVAYDPPAVPVPAAATMGLGLVAIVAARRRR